MNSFYENWEEASRIFLEGSIEEIEQFIESKNMKSVMMKDLFQALGQRNDTLFLSHFMKKNISFLNEALVTASCYGSTKIIKFLLKNKTVDPTFKSCLALREALINKQQSSITMLLEDSRVNEYLLETI